MYISFMYISFIFIDLVFSFSFNAYCKHYKI